MNDTVLNDFWTWLDGTEIPKQREPEPEPTMLSHAVAVTGSGRRKYPSVKVRQAVLKRQRNRCLYCGHKFGTTVRRTRGRTATLQINWDHFVPYAYGLTNGAHNWVAACHVCNNIKSCRMFDTVREAQEYVRARWAEKGYELLAPLLAAELEQPPDVEPERMDLDMTARDLLACWEAYDEETGKGNSFQGAMEAGFRAAYQAAIRAARFVFSHGTDDRDDRQEQ